MTGKMLMILDMNNHGKGEKMNFIPRVNYAYRKCNTCAGLGYIRECAGEWEGEICPCPFCNGEGEMLEVESVEDSNELIEEMWEEEND